MTYQTKIAGQKKHNLKKIRDGLAFESLTAEAMEYEEFKEWVRCVMNATEQDLRNLTY